ILRQPGSEAQLYQTQPSEAEEMWPQQQNFAQTQMEDYRQESSSAGGGTGAGDGGDGQCNKDECGGSCSWTYVLVGVVALLVIGGFITALVFQRRANDAKQAKKAAKKTTMAAAGGAKSRGSMSAGSIGPSRLTASRIA